MSCTRHPFWHEKHAVVGVSKLVLFNNIYPHGFYHQQHHGRENYENSHFVQSTVGVFREDVERSYLVIK